VKQILTVAFLFCSSFGFSQGIYTYQPVDVNVSLPIDTALKAKVENEATLVSASIFEKDFVYHLNYARQHPAVFIKMAVVPYLKAYPGLKEVYGDGLINDLSVLSSLPILSLEPRLLSIARLHAVDLGKNDLMSHQSSNGITTQQRFEKVGIACGTECINYGQLPKCA
jgi:hypothetical protein